MIKLGWNKIGKETLYKTIRSQLGLTRDKMAEILCVSLGAYHHIEMGNVFPGPKVFFKTLEVFDHVSTKDLERYWREREEYIKRTSLRPDRRAASRKRAALQST